MVRSASLISGDRRALACARIVGLVVWMAMLGPSYAPAQSPEGRPTMTDADDTLPDPRRPTLRERLPLIQDVTISWVPYSPPKLRFIKPTHADETEALAFDLVLGGSLPLDRDETPALFVGKEMLVESEIVEPGRVRFLAFRAQAEQLEPSAPIALGWPGRGPENRGRSAFTFQPPVR